MSFIHQKAAVALAQSLKKVAGWLVAQLVVNQGLKLPNRLHAQSVEHVLEASSKLTQHRSASVVPAQHIQNHPVKGRLQRVAKQGLHSAHNILCLGP